MFGWARKVKEIAGLSDGVPIRDGLTYAQDQKRVLDMLCLCGELGGLNPRESYSSYLRRLINRVIELECNTVTEVCRNEKCPRGGIPVEVNHSSCAPTKED